ncbi:MAG: hypothetical protein HXX08_11220 [Chloroflexi bacterium]|uniref:Uncharacterized protein n=1 Tax=Candidatus Chlorohelix allophototropha TaxID=3003348 RepID=A0A8T7M275_9CHLR|nr:hypothetical protein [Chloroflexota bacterium]WJW65807.1 hypothetical protein OZ401_001586 [Chloroflexota bacterium L227-S17]
MTKWIISGIRKENVQTLIDLIRDKNEKIITLTPYFIQSVQFLKLDTETGIATNSSLREFIRYCLKGEEEEAPAIEEQNADADEETPEYATTKNR